MSNFGPLLTSKCRVRFTAPSTSSTSTAITGINPSPRILSTACAPHGPRLTCPRGAGAFAQFRGSARSALKTSTGCFPRRASPPQVRRGPPFNLIRGKLNFGQQAVGRGSTQPILCRVGPVTAGQIPPYGAIHHLCRPSPTPSRTPIRDLCHTGSRRRHVCPSRCTSGQHE